MLGSIFEIPYQNVIRCGRYGDEECVRIRDAQIALYSKHIGKKQGTSAKRLLHQTCKFQIENRPP
jgi:hypothetical protein